MNRLRAWLGRGEAGLPPAAPLDFDRLPPPRSPNSSLAAPPGHPQAQLATPPFATPPAALFAALLQLAEREPRTTRRAMAMDALQAQWVQRSARANFPDLITAEVRPAEGGAALYLHSRSLLGWSDLGVNRARLEHWLTALAATALPAPQPPPPPEPPPPPSPLAVTLAGLAAGRHVVVAGDGTADAPALLLRAASHGAASARILSAERPANADWQLRALGARLGLEAVAHALLAHGRVGTSALPALPHARTDQPHQWWMREDWDAPDLAARLGRVDLLVEPAGLAAAPDPSQRLAQLRRTGAHALLLHTLVPEPGAAPGFTAESLWHAGQLDPVASAALDASLAAQGVRLPQLAALPDRMTPEAVRDAGLTDPAWWFMGEAALRRLLADAGWAPRIATRHGASLILTAIAA